MQIILAVHHFPPHRTAGAELQAYRTALALTHRGHDVRVVCVDSIDATEANGDLLWHDEVVDSLPVRRLRFNLATAANPFRCEYDNHWIGEHLRDYFEVHQPDLFYLYGGYLISARPLLVAHELGIPSAVSLTEFWFLCRRLTMLRSDRTLSTLPLDPVACARCLGEERRIYRLLGQMAPRLMQTYWQLRTDRVGQVKERATFLMDALSKANVVISHSQFVGDMFVRAGFPKERLHFCRQGQKFPQAAVSVPKSTADKIRIGYLGQIAWHKGVHVLVEAIRKLPAANISVSIYGDLHQDPAYVTSLRRLQAGDERIRLAGRFAHAQLAQILQDIDILVVPSLWYENSPNVIFEAFAHHIPVITSNLGGMAELVVHDKNGLVFAAGDADDLAHQLARLIANPTLLSRLTAGIEPVKSLEQEIDELEEIFFSLVENSHRHTKEVML